MKEPWQRDWSGLADWSKLPRLAPTIPALLDHVKATHPEREVLVLDEQATTYGDLDAKSALFARQLLAAGLAKGDRVGVMLPNDETFLVTWLGIARMGAVAVTLPTLAKPAEIARIAGHAELPLLVAPRRYLHHDYATRLGEALARSDQPPDMWMWCRADDHCPRWAHRIDLEHGEAASPATLTAAEAAIRPSDPAAIIYTSGSTAEPKGVIHSQGSFIRAGLKLAASFNYEPGERAFVSLPFFWVGGLTTTMMCLICAGGTMLASGKSGADLLDFIEAQRTTAVVSWPHIIRNLADDPSFPGRAFTHMRNGLFYDALPPDRRPAQSALMATPIGMTETNGPYTVVDRHLGEEQRGSLGRMMPGLQARLIDPDSGAVLREWAEDERDIDSAGQVGVLHVRSDTMMLGMVRREWAEVFTPEGWYATGDLAEFRQGHFHYHGRADDLIKAHGANVSPREVEGVIAKMPGVAAVHAVGVPDRERGTVVGAVVVPQPGHTLDAGAIREAALQELASYKAPRVVLICPAADVPVLPASKIDRLGLVRMLEAAKTQSNNC